MEESFNVFVRIRPPNKKELERTKYNNICNIIDDNILLFDPKPEGNQYTQTNNRREQGIKFGFDKVFDMNSTQLEVYNNTVARMIPSVLKGVNCSCLAYGSTGSGKTHTMIGNDSQPGIMVLTMRDLFNQMNLLQDIKCDFQCSYLEIYNETIRDLLCNQPPLDLREDKDNMVIAGLSAHKPTTPEEVFSLVASGNRNRSQAPTDANSESSRSHGIFQVIVTCTDMSGKTTHGKLSIIDLAGSERASVSNNRGTLLREGANINKSLLALGNCINALAANNGSFVPYRDSKLTRLLKDSLGGHTRTTMIAAVSPSNITREDTHNTLQYANRAKNIVVKVKTNTVFNTENYAVVIADLRKQILELKSQTSAVKSVVTPSRSTNVNYANDILSNIMPHIRKYQAAESAVTNHLSADTAINKSIRHLKILNSISENSALEIDYSNLPETVIEHLSSPARNKKNAETNIKQERLKTKQLSEKASQIVEDARNEMKAKIAALPSLSASESTSIEAAIDFQFASVYLQEMESRLQASAAEIKLLNQKIIEERKETLSPLEILQQIQRDMIINEDGSCTLNCDTTSQLSMAISAISERVNTNRRCSLDNASIAAHVSAAASSPHRNRIPTVNPSIFSPMHSLPSSASRRISSAHAPPSLQKINSVSMMQRGNPTSPPFRPKTAWATSSPTTKTNIALFKSPRQPQPEKHNMSEENEWLESQDVVKSSLNVRTASSPKSLTPNRPLSGRPDSRINNPLKALQTAFQKATPFSPITNTVQDKLESKARAGSKIPKPISSRSKENHDTTNLTSQSLDFPKNILGETRRNITSTRQQVALSTTSMPKSYFR